MPTARINTMREFQMREFVAYITVGEVSQFHKASRSPFVCLDKVTAEDNLNTKSVCYAPRALIFPQTKRTVFENIIAEQQHAKINVEYTKNYQKTQNPKLQVGYDVKGRTLVSGPR
jgi:hypothetical protein